MENLLVNVFPVDRIWAVGVSVVLVIVVMAKHFKDFMEALPSIRKALQYVQRKMFREAIRHKDTMAKLDNIQLILHEQGKKIKSIQDEVTYNGGTVKLTDGVKRIECKVENLTESIEYNKVARGINDKCSDRMLFKMNKEGSCVDINDAFLKFFGWHESDVLDYGFENIVHDDDVNEMRLKWQKAISTKTDFKDEQRIKDCHGAYHLCSVRAYALIVNNELKDFSGVIDKL